MATEILAVPEEHLQEVINVIRAGIHNYHPAREVRKHLEEWCDEEVAYLKGLQVGEAMVEDGDG